MALKVTPRQMYTNTQLGECRRGPSCSFLHDPTKTAICKEYLLKGTCSTSSCNLSHEATPSRVPTCIHFTRGNCTKEDCRYSHVKVNPQAPICPSFAKNRYCEQGADCPNRHEYECPKYAATGECNDPRCRLKHIDRASSFRPKNGENDGHSPQNTDLNSKDDNPFLDSLDAALRSEEQTPSAFSQGANFLQFDDGEEFEKRFQ